MSEETCLNVKKPTSPPAGHYNGYYACTTTGWQWYDSVERKVYQLDGQKAIYLREMTDEDVEPK